MKRLSFNQGTLIFDQNQVRYEIPSKNVYINSTEELQKVHDLPEIGVDCTAQLSSEEDKLVMEFSLSSDLVPFERARMDSTTEVKIQAAEELVRIGEWFSNQEDLVTIFHPINFFVSFEGRVQLLYRGMKGLMPANGYDSDPILDQVKRLILLLFTGARFDELRLNGLSYANQRIREEYRRITKRLLHADDFDEIRKVLQVEKEEIQKSEEGESTDLVVADQKESASSLSTFQSPIISLPMVMITLVVVVISSWIAFSIGRAQSAQPVVQPEVLEGLRLSSIQKYQEAAKQFEKVDYQTLSKPDRKSVLFTYLLSGQAQKAIDLEPNFAESVAKYYIAIDDRGKMLQLKTQAPAIRFEQAWMKKDFGLIIKLKDQVSLDERRKKMLIYSYIAMKKKDQALEYAKKSGEKELIQYAEKLSKAG